MYIPEAFIVDIPSAGRRSPPFVGAPSELATAAFLEGYGGNPEGSPETRFRRKAYSLFKDLIDLDACTVQLGEARSAGILAASVAILAGEL